MKLVPVLSATLVTLALALPGRAAKPTGEIPLAVDLYGSASDLVATDVVDEQDTTTFYHDGSEYCSAANVPGGVFFQATACGGDFQVPGPSAAYGFGGPWTEVVGLLSTRYTDGADCGSGGCMRARFTQGGKTLTFDTQGTSGPAGSSRAVTTNLSQPCTEAGCPGPGGNVADVIAAFGSASVTTSGLFEVFLEFPYTSLGVCSSRACPEAGNAYAKLWFKDSSGRTWRLDWNFLRVLRMSSDAWYFVADECDGSQVAGLSRLDSSQRKQPRTVFNGYYKVPFFLTAARPAR